MASIGIEGAVLKLRNQYLRDSQAAGLYPYLKALFRAILKSYSPVPVSIQIDQQRYRTDSLLSVMITKQPYYGYGMNMCPGARFDDRRLYVSILKFSYLTILLTGLTSFSIGNRMGTSFSGQHVSVGLDRPLSAQIDGDIAWEARQFNFRVLPGELRIQV